MLITCFYYLLLGGESLPERLGPSSTQSKAPVSKRIQTARPSKYEQDIFFDAMT